MRRMLLLTFAVASLALAGCGGSDDDTDVDAGATAIASSERSAHDLGVNSYLWHATLDTLRFMPLASADPFGGVIITDWYSAPEAANERLKVTIYILDRNLRADGLKIAVFRQTAANGAWVDAAVNPDTATKLENAILTRARELRLATTKPN